MMTSKDRVVSLDKGSFRDPAGFVFFLEGNVYRALDHDHFKLITDLVEEGVLDSLVKAGYVVPTRILSEDEKRKRGLKNLIPDWNHFLVHSRIPIITYPYEWSFSMLVDAARLHLDIQLMLIEKGYSLKDASAFNVQFIHHRPVFIDVLSLERPDRLDVWLAYGQFCKMFFYPLLLKRYKHVDFKSIFLGNIEGIDVDRAYDIFGWLGSLRPAVFVDVFLQHLLNKGSDKRTKKLRKKLSEKKEHPTAQRINLKRLLARIENLKASYTLHGHWASYADTCTYSDESENEKIAYIENFLSVHKPSSVLDLGANIGRYSIMAAQTGSDVVAVDSDHDCIEILYRKARSEGLSILPMVMNIALPSPPMGFRNEERKSFFSRVHCQCVFALALVHHLLVTSRIPLKQIRDLLYDLTERYVVVEFIAPDDEMFQVLLASRRNIYKNLTIHYFLETFSEKFELIFKRHITGTKRTLLTFQRKL